MEIKSNSIIGMGSLVLKNVNGGVFLKKMKKTIIIAEAGVNHNGSLKLAKNLVDIASKSGSNYIKFQTFKSNLVFSKFTPKAEYQKKYFKQSNSFTNGKKIRIK